MDKSSTTFCAARPQGDAGGPALLGRTTRFCVVRTPVEVASYGKEEVLIARGLKSGDQVVTLGVHMLSPQKPVRVVEKRTVMR